MATHDALTNLPNKIMIMDRLTHAIEQAGRTKSNIAVLFLDLDHFKHINDTLGHHIGDVYLKQIASRLLKCVRKGDTIGRFGGDEFVILMEGVNLQKDISIVCNKILKIASNTYTIEGHQITNSTSIGVSMYPNDAGDSNSLLKSADLAMYKAKANGGNIYQLYTHDMATTSLERMQMQHALRHSLKNEEFKLHYQPQINMTQGKIDGMEALLRWTNTEFGKVEPEKFIPILEDMGLISLVGSWVIEHACEFNARLISKGHPPLKVSVNLSAKQFNDEKLVSTIKSALDSNALDPAFLEIEITESLLLDNSDHVTNTLEEIHKLGVSISIDDFGTGFSSLAYLKKYPVDSLKIDRSFVNDIPDHKDDIAIVNAIIALGRNLGLSIIAEGVETEQQLSFFKLNKCDHVQGFYISRALSESDFEEILDSEKTYV